MTGTTVRKTRLLLFLTVAFVVSGCAAMRRREARDTGNLLVAAGFTPKPADTPEREQQLHVMPALRMMWQRKDGRMVYRYADPYSCNCLYVGDQQAYAEYKRLALEKQIADERLEAAEAEEMDWDIWGPWGW